MRIGIAAVEVSGDRLGAELMRELKKSFPDARFIGCGGERMLEQGLEMLCHLNRIEAIGIVEVLMRLIPLLRLRALVTRELIKRRVDLFIGVDGPDFNGHIERRLTEAGISCVHYVCPSIWAWRRGRAGYFSRVNRQILCLYPCEKQIIENAGGVATYVGHPLADITPVSQSHIRAQTALGLPGWIAGRKVIGILSGSRQSEIARLLPAFLATARIMCEQQPLALLVSAVNEQREALVSQLVEKHGKGLDVRVIPGEVQQLIASSHLVMVASGTASLETLLVNRPMIVAYRVNWISYRLIRWLIKRSGQSQCNLLTGEPIEQDAESLPLVSQPNLLGGGRLVPEFLQHQVQPKAMAAACLQLLGQDNTRLTALFHHIHLELRNNAASSAAKAIIPLLLEVTGQLAESHK